MCQHLLCAVCSSRGVVTWGNPTAWCPVPRHINRGNGCCLISLLLHMWLLQVWVTIQRPGVFYGQCSELCGANHAFMPIVVEAVTPRQFVTNYLKKWME